MMFRGPFHKGSCEQVLIYEFVGPVLNYRSNKFVALTNLCETGPRTPYLTAICNVYLQY